MALRVLVLYGSVRRERQGIKAARFILGRCRERGHHVTLIDPVEYPLPLLDLMYKEYRAGQAPALLQRLADHVIAADAYIVVSGEYNHGVPPALSNLLDHFLEEYFWKPSAILSYSGGAFGGVRAAMALRAMLAEMGMSSIPSILPVPRVQEAFDDDGRPRDPQWLGRADRFLGELEWYGEALRAARARDGKDTCPPRAQCDEQQSGPAR
jgi:NAD(P)H-dependent FMN reductase